MISGQIKDKLEKIVREKGLFHEGIELTVSEKTGLGDFSTNLPLQLAKLNKNTELHSPVEIANFLLEQFGSPEYIEKIDIAGPGFVNFYIKPEVLARDLAEILEAGESFGRSDIFLGKKAHPEHYQYATGQLD